MSTIFFFDIDDFVFIVPTLTFSAASGFSKGILRTRGLLNYKGTFVFRTPVIFRTVCKVNVAAYPLDKQKCELKFGSWGHNSDLIALKIKVCVKI